MYKGVKKRLCPLLLLNTSIHYMGKGKCRLLSSDGPLFLISYTCLCYLSLILWCNLFFFHLSGDTTFWCLLWFLVLSLFSHISFYSVSLCELLSLALEPLLKCWMIFGYPCILRIRFCLEALCAWMSFTLSCQVVGGVLLCTSVLRAGMNSSCWHPPQRNSGESLPSFAQQ